MRLPRRVPWEHIAQLEQVCAWIYTDENDLDANQRALNRLAAWKAAAPLPHALESVHAILTVILQDGKTATSSSYLSLRMSYASAIIRLVNGLVDPLQLSAYARSIHSIAQQLGLPAWFVELRHAATHEELPSLEVLRDAARQAMNWLLHNYFLPTFNPTAPPAAPTTPLRPLLPLLKQYKTLMKATTRDATLLVHHRNEITKATRDIERWIAEAKVSAPSAVGWADAQDGSGGDDDDEDDEEDPREIWALDRLSEVLLDKGILVPLSKKKRLSPDQASLTLPRFTLAIWTPLLTHLQSLHQTLSLHLVTAIAARLSHIIPAGLPTTDFGADTVSLSAAPEEPKMDLSYDLCLACWAKWLADTGACAGGGGGGPDAEDASAIRETVVVRILSSLGPDCVHTGGISKAANALLQVIFAERPTLATALSVLAQPPAQTSAKDWDDSTISVMDTRLNALLALQTAPDAEDATEPELAESSHDLQLPPGWRRLTVRDGWRPAPIGVYVSCP